jgi:acyl carrier protein
MVAINSPLSRWRFDSTDVHLGFHMPGKQEPPGGEYMPDDLAEKVLTTLASVKHIPREQIKLESSLADLGFDSLDTISMLFELETNFNVAIPDESARSIRYVYEIVDGIRALQAAPSATPASSE